MESQSHSKTSSHYTVFIRLPFERKDFVDPPPVDWNAAKDEALWKVLSSLTGQDIDWKILAERFRVSLPFLLQQAAWLYDRQLSQVRAQVRRVGTKSSFRPVSSESVTARDGGRPPSTRDSHFQENLAWSKANMSNGCGPAASPEIVSGGPSLAFLRNATANLSVEPKLPAATTANSTTVQPELQGSTGSSGPDKFTKSVAEAAALPPPLESRPSFLDAPSDLDEEDSTDPPSESDNDTSTHNRRISSLRHFNMLSHSRPSMKSYQEMTDDDGEESSLPTFIPLAEEEDEEADEPQSSGTALGHYEDPNATILGSPGPDLTVAAVAAEAATHDCGLADGMTTNTAITPGYSEQQFSASTSNSNSVSTVPNISATYSTGSIGAARRVVPLATPASSQTRHSTKLDVMNDSLSPRSRTSIIAREETDSTASTASSFSDLDDTSVTRSALEEAYLSGVQNGGIASRVGTISQAFKSRYLSRQ
ncbi:hypothetical protein KEM54_006188 [Ascosphaera aggregata]|nr:hypothetical protein KEM54_006188 [Ascosphaera aggregata]